MGIRRRQGDTFSNDEKLLLSLADLVKQPTFRVGGRYVIYARKIFIETVKASMQCPQEGKYPPTLYQVVFPLIMVIPQTTVATGIFGALTINDVESGSDNGLYLFLDALNVSCASGNTIVKDNRLAPVRAPLTTRTREKDAVNVTPFYL
jgi:hypothetical protein